jgi:hypothetical protein
VSHFRVIQLPTGHHVRSSGPGQLLLQTFRRDAAESAPCDLGGVSRVSAPSRCHLRSYPPTVKPLDIQSGSTMRLGSVTRIRLWLPRTRVCKETSAVARTHRLQSPPVSALGGRIVTPDTSPLPHPSMFPFPFSLYLTSLSRSSFSPSARLQVYWVSAWLWSDTLSVPAVRLTYLDTKFCIVKVWPRIFFESHNSRELGRF